MIKQNVPGFYGLGTVIESLIKSGRFEELKSIYRKSLFFRTLIDNSEMSLFKTFLPLTQQIEDHPEYGIIWKKKKDEFELTKKNLLLLGDHDMLMEAYPVERLSVNLRERIILPVNTIQQYALSKLRDNQWGMVTQSGQFVFDQPVGYALGSWRNNPNAGSPSLLETLVDGAVTNLTQSPDAVGQANDYMFAVQFSFSGLGDGESVTFRSLSTVSVPEPATLALFMLGGVGMCLSRRRMPARADQAG